MDNPISSPGPSHYREAPGTRRTNAELYFMSKDTQDHACLNEVGPFVRLRAAVRHMYPAAIVSTMDVGGMTK